MENTNSDGAKDGFNGSTYDDMIQHVFTRSPYSESHPNNLACLIHPIFYRRNWESDPIYYPSDWDRDECFYLMVPVIRLASNLLQSPNSRVFIDNVFNGERKRLDDLSNKLGREAWQFDRIKEANFSEVLTRTNKLLQRLAAYVKFDWFDPSYLRLNPFMAGFCGKKPRTLAYMSSSAGHTGHGSKIYFNIDNLRRLRHLRLNLRNSSSPSVDGISSQILRLQFVMAVTMCHEIVHACNKSIKLDDNIPEPFFEDERIAELGHSWESAVIGGTWSSTGEIVGYHIGDMLATNPLLIVEWPGFDHRGTQVSLERDLPPLYQNKYYIPMDWIARIQQEDQWQSTDPDYVSALLDIPKTLGFTQKYPLDDFDPNWESKYSNNMEYPQDVADPVL